MKNKLLGFSFMVTILSSFIMPTRAESEISIVNQNSVRNIVNITPADLVDSAYQGRMVELGIPSYGAFSRAAKSGRVDSQLLVKSGIQSGRLDPETINDQGYLNQVKSFLRHLDQD